MDLSVSSSLSTTSSSSLSLSRKTGTSFSYAFKNLKSSSSSSNFPNLVYKSRISQRRQQQLASHPVIVVRAQIQNQTDNPNDAFILEDVPHLTNFLPDLPVFPPSPSPSLYSNLSFGNLPKNCFTY